MQTWFYLSCSDHQLIIMWMGIWRGKNKKQNDQPYKIYLAITETPRRLKDKWSFEKQFKCNRYRFYLCFGAFVIKIRNGVQIQREDSVLLPIFQPNQLANNFLSFLLPRWSHTNGTFQHLWRHALFQESRFYRDYKGFPHPTPSLVLPSLSNLLSLHTKNWSLLWSSWSSLA